MYVEHSGLTVRRCFFCCALIYPRKEVKLDEKKTMFAYLGVMNPVICTCDVRAAKEYDSGIKVV